MKLALGCDHGGYLLKEEVKKHLDAKGIEYVDFGCHNTESCDYPDMADAPCKAVTSGDCTYALLFLRHRHWHLHRRQQAQGHPGSLLLRLLQRPRHPAAQRCQCTVHGRSCGRAGLACQMVDEFLAASFEGGRHQRRVDKLTALEQ